MNIFESLKSKQIKCLGGKEIVLTGYAVMTLFISSAYTVSEPSEEFVIKTEELVIEKVSETIEEVIVEESKEKSEEELINFYSKVYSLDPIIVYDIISNLTNNFTDQNYIENNVIEESSMKGMYVECTSKEMAIIIITRKIYYEHESYGYTSNEIFTGEEYICNLDYIKQVSKISDILGVDKKLVYAICMSESGFDSQMFIEKNNPTGLRLSGESFSTFASSFSGIIEQCLETLKLNMKGVHLIEQIGSIHAPSSDPSNSFWISNVSYFYNAVDEDDEMFAYADEDLYFSDAIIR